MMAASSQEEPALDSLRIGATKKEVQAQLGRPITDFREPVGSVATYQYFSGDDASYQRAATYAVLDGVTLGLAELFTFPTEALQGTKHTVTIHYDRFDRVLRIKESVQEAPLDKPEKIIGLEKESI